MKLVVGLGNPGPRYAQTRHNVGFMVVDQVLRSCPQTKRKEKFAGLFSQVLIDDQSVALLEPTTSMNLSGIAVAQALNFYKLPLSELLVVTDDLALPSGRLRIRRAGSSGGHKGLASIEQYLNSQDFARLRIGIGPSNLPDPADYVLAEFSDQEWLAVSRALELAVEAVRCWITQGIDLAMNRFNASPAASDDDQAE